MANMPKPSVTRRRRFVGTLALTDEQFDRFVQVLNENENCAAGRRIIALVEQLVALAEARDRSHSLQYGEKEPIPAQWREQSLRRASRLNQMLRRYALRPVITCPFGVGWFADWWPVPGKRDGTLKCGDRQVKESSVIDTFMKIAADASVQWRLRRCKNCGKWIFAKFKHQTFCSTACQQKHYTQSEEWKAHRREYMRAYRKENY